MYHLYFWQETYVGLIDAESWKNITQEKCKAIAHKWTEKGYYDMFQTPIKQLLSRLLYVNSEGRRKQLKNCKAYCNLYGNCRMIFKKRNLYLTTFFNLFTLSN